MNFTEIFRLLSVYLKFLAGALCCPLIVSVYFEFFCKETMKIFPQSAMAFFQTILIALFLSVLFKFLGRKSEGKIFRKECLAAAVLIWFLTGAVGALPYWLSDTLSSPLDCYFESVSGLTTTGATVMHPKKYDEETGDEVNWDVVVEGGKITTTYKFYGTVNPIRDSRGSVLYSGIEAVSKGVLFWRSFSQWLGGMGIVVLFVAILPAFGVGSRVLMRSEVTGPVKEEVAPRIKESAAVLWKIYVGLTLGEVLILKLVNSTLPWFDAFTIAFSNLSTGGFTIKNGSIASYNHAGMEWVILLFMILGSINFTHYYYLLKGKLYKIFEPELFVYLISLLVGSFIMVLTLYLPEGGEIHSSGVEHFSFGKALRYGIFQLVSAQTSTGFSTADYEMWPYLNQVLLFIVMYLGSMAGSTGGGMKIARHFLLAKFFFKELESVYRPEVVKGVKVGGAFIYNKVESAILGFFFSIVALSIIGTFLFIMDGLDPQTALGVNGCMINNVGIAFRAAGPSQSFAFLPAASTLISILWMILGRLEFLGVLVFFIPRFWKKY
jgi:trk system potassium uptake protein